jgi:geranylgeranyl diphosphate synthase type II
LEVYDAPVFKALSRLFSRTAQEVCEGQQYDMDFETRNNVSLEEYIEMIRLKTSVLVAASLQMGAIVAGASVEDQVAIYQFGIALGLAFQLQDDYLDTFGHQDTFGKQIGGDILENKKTWLYLKALERAPESDKEVLFNLYNTTSLDSDTKIDTVKQFFKQNDIDILIQKEIQQYSEKALLLLQDINLKANQKMLLSGLVSNLAKRTQ